MDRLLNAAAVLFMLTVGKDVLLSALRGLFGGTAGRLFSLLGHLPF